MKKGIITIAFAFLALLSLANGNPTSAGTTVLRGHVIDSATGDELTGVRVCLEGSDLVVYSDKAGYFEIEVPSNLATAQLKLSFVSFETLQISTEKLSSNPIEIPLAEK